ncbi:FdtA/QdtA family cupin domain-containing protein [Halarcobacter sp.]|uniref:sugar 3,4-ketoisomerase n=1 Tax=Halarcobacter sp. TaxID=2321133 RepID=UPI002AAB6208|nr:FdtA/QdtA family cupin domain-containing protein [Halarcobacter sp.]
MIGKLINLKIHGDDRGSLIALENSKSFPFEIKRVFYIFGTQEGISRGNHSHYKTKQFLISISGSCKVTLDDGINKKTFNLDKPNLGLLQDPYIWGTMHDFSEDCVLMVLADDLYKEDDYIRDYDKFLEVIKND